MLLRIKRALVSVSDKTGIIDLCRFLSDIGVEIVSTGGTAAHIRDSGLTVTDVSELTGFPEIMGGRVKTLHPKVHAGILADKSNSSHMKQIEELGILPFDMVVVNLYPFEKTVFNSDAKKATDILDLAIENIDIGGPSMVRAAAKNYNSIAIVTHPSQYESIMTEIEKEGGITDDTRMGLAVTAFETTAWYDGMISRYLREIVPGEELPERVMAYYEKVQTLRYGENPYQMASVYMDPSYRFPFWNTMDVDTALSRFKKYQGKEISYNNFQDLYAAFNVVAAFNEPTAVVMKHTNPCGLASRNNITEAFKEAWDGDPQSAFGGIIALNRPCTKEIAEFLSTVFVEIVIAPGYEDGVLDVLAKKKNVRVLESPAVDITAERKNKIMMRHLGPYMLMSQNRMPSEKEVREGMTVPTVAKPTDQDIEELLFAWKAVSFVKSNAIVLTKEKKLVGVGAGQMSRVDSVKIAIEKAGDRAKGSYLASDAFFPFRDNIDTAARAGVKAIIQPGGSIRDKQSIEACNEYNIPMIFTGMRVFRH